MKKFSSFLTAFFITFSLYTYGQVTITADNFPRVHTFIDTVYSPPNPSVFSLPSEGANQVWDYSGIPLTSSFTIPFSDASADPYVSGAFSIRSVALAFQGFPIESYEYDRLDNNGWSLIARRTYEAKYSIANVTGGAQDSIIFPEFVDIYGGESDQLSFPLTYQSSWSGTRIETFPLQLSVAAYQLNKAPGTRVRYLTDTREVVGYGKLTMPDDNGNPSNELDVLLIKSTVEVLDSFFLGNDPAPSQLLDAFQLTQGDASTNVAYLFYMPNYGKPVMRFGVSASGTETTGIGFRTSATRVTTTSVNELQLTESTKFFPNPVNAGNTITINFDNAKEDVSLSLTDLSGRLIHSKRANFSAGSRHFEIPQTASGIYLLNVKSPNGELISSAQILIK